jgi:hypothetical protein
MTASGRGIFFKRLNLDNLNHELLGRAQILDGDPESMKPLLSFSFISN